jgi:hypothetical protein
MSNLDVVYEITCVDCDSKFEILTNEENEFQPTYCTFCGFEIIDDDIDEEDEHTFDDTYKELKELFKDE